MIELSLEVRNCMNIEQRHIGESREAAPLLSRVDRPAPSKIDDRRAKKNPMEIMRWLGAIRDKYRQVFGLAKTSQKELKERLDEELEIASKEATREGVDFSRCQMNKFVEDYKAGKRVEFESFSPYLADYNSATGEVWEDKLAPSDAVGVAIAKMLREQFPRARMISLYDEYNTDMPSTADARGIPTPDGPQIEFSSAAKNRFRTDIEGLLRKKAVLKDGDIERKNYLFVSESEKIKDAEDLVKELAKGKHIRRDGQAIYFENPNAENPMYQEVLLRTKNGRWLCEALDASSYLKSENLEITHLVILPEHFKRQQDKVWEILRVLGIKPLNYHNIFFDEAKPPEKVVKMIEEEIKKWL